jgi:hypothetical protein
MKLRNPATMILKRKRKQNYYILEITKGTKNSIDWMI